MNTPVPPPLPETRTQSAAAPTARPLHHRIAVKLLAMAAVIVGLQVPPWLIDSKREERAARNASAVGEITAAWGGSQRLVGALLSVPARRTDGAGDVFWLRVAPDELAVTGELEPRELRRGIFGYLYFVLRLEDLSLVSGTALLFVLLGAVMYATRHLHFDETASLAELGEARASRS